MEGQIYIRTELLFLVPVMNFIGSALRRSKIKNRYIPMILGMVSIVASVSRMLMSDKPSGAEELIRDIVEGIFQGILIAGASVYANQLFKQTSRQK